VEADKAGPQPRVSAQASTRAGTPSRLTLCRAVADGESGLLLAQAKTACAVIVRLAEPAVAGGSPGAGVVGAVDKAVSVVVEAVIADLGAGRVLGAVDVHAVDVAVHVVIKAVIAD